MPTVSDKSVQGIIDVLGPMSSGGGVTSIIAGTGISVNQGTGAVTITNSAPGGSGSADYLGGVGAVRYGTGASGAGGNITVSITGCVAGATYTVFGFSTGWAYAGSVVAPSSTITLSGSNGTGTQGIAAAGIAIRTA